MFLPPNFYYGRDYPPLPPGMDHPPPSSSSYHAHSGVTPELLHRFAAHPGPPHATAPVSPRLHEAAFHHHHQHRRSSVNEPPHAHHPSHHHNSIGGGGGLMSAREYEAAIADRRSFEERRELEHHHQQQQKEHQHHHQQRSNSIDSSLLMKRKQSHVEDSPYNNHHGKTNGFYQRWSVWLQFMDYETRYILIIISTKFNLNNIMNQVMFKPDCKKKFKH